MKSGGPWNLRGLRPETREAARTAARRSGMSVGEWLNNVIEPDDENDDQDEPALFFDEDDELEDERPRRSRSRGREQEPEHRREREPERRRERAERRREQPEPRREQPEHRQPERDSEFDRETAKTKDDLNEVHARLDRLSHQLERMARNDTAARRPPPPPPPPPPQPQRRRPPSNGDANGAPNGRLTGAPAQPRRAAERPAVHTPAPAPSRRPPSADAENDIGTSIDDAVAEIAARQRVLDGDVEPELVVHDAPSAAPAPEPPREEPTPPREELTPPRQEPTPPSEEPAPPPAFYNVPEPPVIDISSLDQQLRQITARIEALRPSSDLEDSVAGIRTDLTEIARLITEALPRRAVESLEIEVKALAQRIEHTRQCGVDMGAITGLERGLNEVRDALRASDTGGKAGRLRRGGAGAVAKGRHDRR